MVWIAVSAVFAVLAMGVLIRLLAVRRSLRTMTEDLREINEGEADAWRLLNVETPDSSLQELAGEVNRYMKAAFRRSNEQKLRERRIREEITSISHDLRTPLTSILGYLELLEEMPSGGPEREMSVQEREECLRIVRRRSSYLSKLVEELYEYSRLENHELKLNLERIDLRVLFQEHLLEYYGEFERRGLEVELQAPEEAVYVRADREGLGRILHNLTSNCLKYAEGRVEVALKVQGEEALIEYRNAAGNLTKEDVEHLFERFYQKDEARSGSSGLGLAVAKLLAEEMGGRMEAWMEDGWVCVRCGMKE